MSTETGGGVSQEWTLVQVDRRSKNIREKRYLDVKRAVELNLRVVNTRGVRTWGVTVKNLVNS